MTDEQILEEVYWRLGGTGHLGEKVRSFIEQEWQKRDEADDWRPEMFTENDDNKKTSGKDGKGMK
jgi:hypothetical protein